MDIPDRTHALKVANDQVTLGRVFLVLAVLQIAGGPYGFIKSSIFAREHYDAAAHVMTLLGAVSLFLGLATLALAIRQLSLSTRRKKQLTGTTSPAS
jgi:hypothetical protein